MTASNCATRAAMSTRYFGAHTIDNGGIDMAVARPTARHDRAADLHRDSEVLQREDRRPPRARRAVPRRARRRRASRRERVVVHAAYVLNVATPDEEKWARAPRRPGEGARALDRARRSARSAFTRARRPTATARRRAERVAQGDHARAARRSTGDTRLLVENTAGAGNTVGAHGRGGRRRSSRDVPSDAARAHRLRARHLPPLRGGYDIARRSRTRRRRSSTSSRRRPGEPPAFFHLNDSEGALGSNKDRHMLIGEATIGEEAFGWLLADRRTHGHAADPRDAAAELRDRRRRCASRSMGRKNDASPRNAGRGMSVQHVVEPLRRRFRRGEMLVCPGAIGAVRELSRREKR